MEEITNLTEEKIEEPSSIESSSEDKSAKDGSKQKDEIANAVAEKGGIAGFGKWALGALMARTAISSPSTTNSSIDILQQATEICADR